MSNPFTDKINVIIGGIVAVLSYILGDNWWLFAMFLFMNVGDWLTGWYKSYVNHKENSEKGWIGVLKKMCYWFMVALSFCMAEVFIQIGKDLGVNLQVTSLFGWFVLASLFINEIRSIIENLVEADIYVPEVLKRGLEVADKMLKEKEDKMNSDGEESQ